MKGKLAWPWGLFTLLGGLVFALLRGRAADVIDCTIAHGRLDAVGEGLPIVMGMAL